MMTNHNDGCDSHSIARNIAKFNNRPMTQLEKWNAEARAEFMRDPGNVVDLSERFRLYQGLTVEERAALPPSPSGEIIRTIVFTPKPPAWVEVVFWVAFGSACLLGTVGVCLSLLT